MTRNFTLSHAFTLAFLGLTTAVIIHAILQPAQGLYA